MSDKSEIEAIRAVTRYTQPCVQQQLGPEFKVAEVPLFESAKGKYVLFTDYAVLLSHLDEQAKRIERASKIITDLVPPHAMELCDECDGTAEGCRIACGGNFCEWRMSINEARAFLASKEQP